MFSWTTARSSEQPVWFPPLVRSQNPNGGVCVNNTSISLGNKFHLDRHS